MKNTTIATVRTSVNAAVTGALVAGASRIFGWHIDLADPAVIAIAGVGTGIVYRASRVLSDRIPVLGYVLFGYPDQPMYRD